MTLTKEKVVEAGQDAVAAASSWVSDVAETLVDSVAEAADKVDVEGAKETVNGATTAAFAAAAPVAAIATKKVLKRSTFLGLALSGAAAYFLDPNKGPERRTKAGEYLRQLVEKAKTTVSSFGKPKTTTNPSFSTQQVNETQG